MRGLICADLLTREKRHLFNATNQHRINATTSDRRVHRSDLRVHRSDLRVHCSDLRVHRKALDLTVYNHANNFREWIFPLALCISGSFFNISRPFLKEIPAAAGVPRNTLHVETQKNSYAKDKLKATAYAPPRFYASKIHASLFFENTDDGEKYICMHDTQEVTRFLKREA